MAVSLAPWTQLFGSQSKRHSPKPSNRSRQRRLQVEVLEDRRVMARTVGLFKNTPASFEGYTLIAPGGSYDTYLINNAGFKVHRWSGDVPPMSAYLQEDGSIIRVVRKPNANFPAGGAAGAIQQWDWDGNKIWEYTLNDSQSNIHHDIAVLPNGNVLANVWNRMSSAEAIREGKTPSEIDDINGQQGIWSEQIIEIKPDYKTKVGGKIVWKWDLRDHLVQEDYPSKNNYYGPNGVQQHPELVDFNWIQPREPRGSVVLADWTHFNGLDYNADLDQISISVREFSEFWIIDHSTTTEEASGHRGGNSGKGGDLLYRYGNPETYDSGGEADRILYHQHNAAWVANGLPGQGNVTVFNNGSFRPGGVDFSSIEEVALPIKNEYQFYFNNKTNGSVSSLVRFAKAEVGGGWTPITGDWSGNGRDSAGLYNKISNKFVLYKNNVTGGKSRIIFRAADGARNWLPITGDWNGDGKDTPGLYDPVQHVFYFYDYAANGVIRLAGTFTTDSVPRSWVPVAGDWNGDGKDTVGLYDSSTGTFYLRRRNEITPSTLIQYHIPNSRSGWKPIAGDWNNDGKDDVGLYDSANHKFYFHSNLNGDNRTVTTFVSPDVPSSWLPIVGNWDGKRGDTVGLYNPHYRPGGQYNMDARPAPVWHYQAQTPTNFNSPIISGAQRLPNGNTLIDSGVDGRFFEVNRQGRIVWSYVNPVMNAVEGVTDPRGRLRWDQQVPDAEFGGLKTNFAFRVLRYSPDFAAFKGRDLTPKKRIEIYGPSTQSEESSLLDDFAANADELFADLSTLPD